MCVKNTVILILLLMSTLFFNQIARAEAIINLSQTVNGPAVLNDDGSYSVTYIISAENSGDVAGNYDLVLQFSTVQIIDFEDFLAFRVVLEYAPGGETQSGSPGLNGPLVVEGDAILNANEVFHGFTPYQIITEEGLQAGASETWTLTADFEIFTPDFAAGRRNESGDFFLGFESGGLSRSALDDIRLCDDANPIEGTGFFLRTTGSDTDPDDTDNTACTDLPAPDINITTVADGPAVVNVYGNYKVDYTITVTNTGQGFGYYGLDAKFSPGAGIEMVMAFLACVSLCDGLPVVNTPAFVDDPAPLNRGGRWAFFQLVRGTHTAYTAEWKVSVAYKVNPVMVSGQGSDCHSGIITTGPKETGFTMQITDEGGFGLPPLDEDFSDNRACVPLVLPVSDLPDINVSQKINNLPALNQDNTYTLEYTITASNTGSAAGLYDLVYEFSPAPGITLEAATLSYSPGGETQTGTPLLSLPLEFSQIEAEEVVGFIFDEETGEVIEFLRTFYILVVAEQLAAGATESWTVIATFDVDPGVTDSKSAFCNPATPQSLTGFHSRVIGNLRVAGKVNTSYYLGDDLSDNTTCAALSGIEINPGLNGAWFNPATPGQGFFLEVFPDINLVFIAWFTYDTSQVVQLQSYAANNPFKQLAAARVGDENQRWLTAQGAFDGNTANLTVTLTTGGLFDDSTPTVNTSEGTMTLSFSDCATGTVDYNFTAGGVSGSVPISRIANDNVPICEQMDGIPDDFMDKTNKEVIATKPAPASEKLNASAIFGISPGLNGAWFNPATAGQGFFLEVFADINLVFMSWFTYDTTQPVEGATAQVGDPGHRWLTAQGSFDGTTANLNVTLTTGGLFDDPTPVINTPEGTITLTFQDCSSGTVDYNFTAAGVSGSVPIARLANDNVLFCESL